ncbi:MAG TPA: DUF6054 family protein [Candidatus Acidoferrum sp.]|nr:DUF6054 family protein [Candidatus Acidoferrum sp.]
MAIFEQRLRGNFDRVLGMLEEGVIQGNISASLEDGSDYTTGDVRCAVRVFERYSMIGGNRVSLNITLVGRGDELFLSAIASGGSQAMLFKINTFGEEAFLDRVRHLMQDYLYPG